jgi:hypothetical protein
MDSSGHTLAYQQQNARPPPPSGPAPLYSRTINRLFPYSLRPVMLISCIISLVYLVLLGGNDFKEAEYTVTSSKLTLFNIVEGVLFVVAALIEVFGLYAAYTVSDRAVIMVS